MIAAGNVCFNSLNLWLLLHYEYRLILLLVTAGNLLLYLILYRVNLDNLKFLLWKKSFLIFSKSYLILRRIFFIILLKVCLCLLCNIFMNQLKSIQIKLYFVLCLAFFVFRCIDYWLHNILNNLMSLLVFCQQCFYLFAHKLCLFVFAHYIWWFKSIAFLVHPLWLDSLAKIFKCLMSNLLNLRYLDWSLATEMLVQDGVAHLCILKTLSNLSSFLCHRREGFLQNLLRFFFDLW